MSDIFIYDNHMVKNKIIEKIKDSRLDPCMKRVRSGSVQMFRRDYKDNQFIREENADIILYPQKRSYYSKLIDDEWYWVEGCYECNGERRDWMCYVECEEHDRCSKCGINRKDLKGVAWGGKDGWTCNTCEEARKLKERTEAISAFEGCYDEWDFEGLSTPKCPYCALEIDEYWDYFDSDLEEDVVIECYRCQSKFECEAEKSVSFTSRKIELDKNRR